MDVREKLVELIEKASYECDEGTRDLLDMREVADGIADFLIANGVTVQEWISVKDRLPEEMEKVMAFVNGVRITAVLKGGVWLSSWNHDPVNDDVTHWMPLPQPPKGE